MSLEDFLRTIDRRTFLKILAITGASGLIYPRDLISALNSSTLSRVVIVKDDTATSGSSINESVVQVMVDSGIKSLTQQSTVGEAWKSLMPGINSSSVVAIKVNCLNSSMPTHPEVAYAVANSLKQMSFAGVPFPENDIIIYDQQAQFQSSGYNVNTSNKGIRCIDTDSTVGYTSESYSVNGISQRLSKVITSMADYLINIAVLKNHGGVSGVTLCLKNHLGTCNRPSSLHTNNGDPYIAALNALSPIKTKQVVCIIDALFGVKSGGPGGYPQFVANKILMSQDIVAVDYLGRQLLKDKGCTTISFATHIDTAATKYGLGTNDPSQMEIVNVNNPTSNVSSGDRTSHPGNFLLQQNFPNPFNSQTQIQFYVPRLSSVTISLSDITGRDVRNLANGTMNTGWHRVAWDGYDEAGKKAASGVYICQMKASGFQKTIVMQLIR